jgi:hypothetical protein
MRCIICAAVRWKVEELFPQEVRFSRDARGLMLKLRIVSGELFSPAISAELEERNVMAKSQVAPSAK